MDFNFQHVIKLVRRRGEKAWKLDKTKRPPRERNRRWIEKQVLHTENLGVALHRICGIGVGETRPAKTAQLVSPIS